jgi:phosphate transport system substrate-binding protein
LLLKRLATVSAATLVAGCAVGLSAAEASAATLNGQGSTLVAPLAQEWIAAWDPATSNTVNFQATGSGAGYKGVASGADDFGASDAPLSAYSSPPCNNCVQIPWALSATGVAFNVSGLTLPRGKPLRLTPQVLAGIYLGTIKTWNDPSITRLNPGAHIPGTTITPIWRNDASGDSFAFTSELSDVSGTFHTQVGPSTQPAFPTGVGAHGNSGMATALQSTNGGIAYISVAYLIVNGLTHEAIAVQNRAGRYEEPNLTAIENAAAVVHSVPAGNQVTIVNPPRSAKNAYPISTFTYVMAPTNAPQGALLQSFIGYALSSAAQSLGPRLGFAPLPRDVHNAAEATLRSI